MDRFISIILALAFFSSLTTCTYTNSQNAIQVLKKLGMVDGLTKPDIKRSKGKRKNDSPIYYIKLPPTAHFYHHKLPPAVVPLLPPPPPPMPPMDLLHHLPIDFTNNGRPELVRNWHYPPTLIKNPTNPTYSPLPPFHTQTGYVSDPYMGNEVNDIDNPLLLPPELPLITKRPINKVPTYPLDPASRPAGNSLISLKDPYIYNGKPSLVYIWKPHKRITITKPKFKHPYFKHFNY